MRLGVNTQRLLAGFTVCFVAAFTAPSSAQPVGGNVTGGNAGSTTTEGTGFRGSVTGGHNSIGNVGVTLGEVRRYIVEFHNFVAVDETGCDLCGSDEVQFIIRTSDYALLSSVYGDIDSSYVFPTGDGSPIAYRFKRCALPAVDGDNEYDNEWECDQSGKAPPLSFTIEAWERDGSPFDICAENGVGADLWPPATSFCAEDDGELIGKSKVEVKMEDLSGLQSPGQTSEVKEIDLVGGCDFTKIDSCGSTAPHYVVRYTVKRMNDATGAVLVDPNP